MRKIVGLFALFLINQIAFAQVADTSIFRFPIQMDSVVVKAIRSGWDLQAFIRRMQQDTSFHKAFHNLHLVSFQAKNEVWIYSPHGRIKAGMRSETIQKRENGCRSMSTISQKSTGDFFTKNGQYRYYTTALFAYLFLEKGPVCNENPYLPKIANNSSGSRLARNKQTLKELIFNPGSKISGIPLLGKSTAIFDEANLACYDFKLEHDLQNGEECYLFKATAKPSCKNELVYQELDTWFRKSDYTILARNYALHYSTVVYDFDLKLEVRLSYIDGLLIPVHVAYNGDWRILTKGRELGSFLFDLKI